MAEETFGQKLMAVRGALSPYKGLIEKMEKAIEDAHLAEASIKELTERQGTLQHKVEELGKQKAQMLEERVSFTKSRDQYVAEKEKQVGEQVAALEKRLRDATAAHTAAVEKQKLAAVALSADYERKRAEYDAGIAALEKRHADLNAEIDEMMKRLQRFVAPVVSHE